jgi:quinone-modifying oxidoreductase, subunit QmoC
VPETVVLKPDAGFIRAVVASGGEDLKKCFQCGTCSATCGISPDRDAFPRKEMQWASWGLKDRLLGDPDIWLCHQCNDCSTRCPRGARPGDVLAAIRQQAVLHYAAPRFLARWLTEPQSIPLVLGIPAALLTLALLARDPVGKVLGLAAHRTERIVFSYSSMFPQWLLDGFFGFFALLVLVVTLTGVFRLWRAMTVAVSPQDRDGVSAAGLIPSMASTLVRVVTHRDFASCTATRSRFIAHACTFLGFVALSAVTLWVITAPYNPLINGSFVYPFGFWNPWKMLANAGGAAVVVGCGLMIRDRLRETRSVSSSTFADWALLSTLLLVTLTGFVTEVLHFERVEPHRHIAYFVHLVFVLTALLYLPYAKLAHLAYRFTAMVFSEHVGRNRETSATAPASRPDGRREG